MPRPYQPPYTIDTENNPLLEIALEIATEQHAGQKRGSGHDYITHPMMVYYLRQLNGGDTVQKAVALLHDTDVKEDGKLTNEQLGEVLLQKIFERCNPNSAEQEEEYRRWVAEVCRGVKEMTNDSIRYGGKRTYQVNRAREMDPRFKPVKQEDQTATVLDAILHCDYRNSSKMEREKVFALKGLDVSRACADSAAQAQGEHTAALLNKSASAHRQATNQNNELYKYLFNELGTIYKLAKEGNYSEIERIRSEYVHHNRLEALVDRAKRARYRETVPAERVSHYYCPQLGHQDSGIVRITISDKTRKVVGFGIIINVDTEQSIANDVAGNFLKHLEQLPAEYTRQGRQVRTRKTAALKTIIEQKYLETFNHCVDVRDCTLHPPVSLKTFIDLAWRANTIDSLFAARMELEASKPLHANGKNA